MFYQDSKINHFSLKVVKVRIHASQQNNLCNFGNVSSTTLYNHFTNYCYLKLLCSPIIFLLTYFDKHHYDQVFCLKAPQNFFLFPEE